MINFIRYDLNEIFMAYYVVKCRFKIPAMDNIVRTSKTYKNEEISADDLQR